MHNKIDIKDFAERVEWLCEYVLNQIGRGNDPFINKVIKLKDDAANLQYLKMEGETNEISSSTSD